MSDRPFNNAKGVFFIDYSMMGDKKGMPGCLYLANLWFDKHGYPCITVSDATEANSQPGTEIPPKEVWDQMFAEAFKPRKKKKYNFEK